jgi:site-specific DNA-methyltransferase (adenine-specific)
VGGINIDDCRIPLVGENNPIGSAKRVFKSNEYTDDKIYGDNKITPNNGRFPSNFIHDGSDDVLEHFPDSETNFIDKPSDCDVTGNTSFDSMRGNRPARGYNGRGSASRFFYCAKPSPTERNLGCSDLPLKPSGDILNRGGHDDHAPVAQNNHPTVKALTLMEYLVTMITPPGGTCYDPFTGSGTTMMVCEKNEINGIGSETESDYCEIAKRRVGAVKGNGQQSLFK